VHISSGSEEMLLTGDVVVNSAVSFLNPEWPFGFDMDVPLATKARMAFLDRAAADKTLVGSGQAVSFSTATVFKPGRTAIVGRFGLSGANPFQADQPAIVRSMAVKFLLPGAGEWRITMNNEAVFGVNSAQGFRDQVLASIPDPANGKPDPAKVKAFMAAHPETVRVEALKRNGGNPPAVSRS
jgi:catalase